MKLNASAEMPPLPAKNADRSLSQSTLENWGEQLPIGFLKDGVFHRNIEFKNYTLKEERAMSKKRQQLSKNSSSASFVHTVLCHMIESIGPFDDFSSMTDNNKSMILGQMFMADILYAYVILRIQALGDKFQLDIECPSCANKTSLSASLNDLDVFVPENPSSVVEFYEPSRPLKVGKKKIQRLILNPPRWNTMLQLKAQKIPDVADLKMKLIQSTVVGYDDGDHISPSVLENLSKYDFELLSKTIDDHRVGTTLILGYECPNCGHQDNSNLQWDFDHFFGSSSL